MLLDGVVCAVTGAASKRGIGRATAKMLVKHGARVAILDLDEDEAKAAAAEITSDALGLPCDVTDKDECERAASALVEHFGRLDVLVNNAGITQPLKFLEIEPEHYDAVTDVSQRGTLYMSQAAVPHMQRVGGGSIINMSSVSAERGGGIFGGPHYSAAKAGVLGLTRAMARELGAHGIRVNAVAPGLIQTDITGGKLTPEMRAKILDGVPLGRLGEVEDVAGICVFLASKLAAYVTGATLDVNGGMHIH